MPISCAHIAHIAHILGGIWKNIIPILILKRKLSVDFSPLTFAASLSMPVSFADLVTEILVSLAQRLVCTQALPAAESLPAPKASEFIHGRYGRAKGGSDRKWEEGILI
jgi:hypothetical protein